MFFSFEVTDLREKFTVDHICHLEPNAILRCPWDVDGLAVMKLQYFFYAFLITVRERA